MLRAITYQKSSRSELRASHAKGHLMSTCQAHIAGHTYLL